MPHASATVSGSEERRLLACESRQLVETIFNSIEM
jgi:hypothetical protein